MHIEAKFIKSITSIKDKLYDRPTYLIMGRSNVGKSSFINAISNRLNIARVSSNPGKTITMNYYDINDRFYLLDSPGYGYAKRSKMQISLFNKMLESFLSNADYKKTILLIDFKVGPTKDDLAYFEILKKYGHDILIVCTKYDKVNSSTRYKNIKDIESLLGTNKICYFSSFKKIGIDEVRDILFES